MWHWFRRRLLIAAFIFSLFVGLFPLLRVIVSFPTELRVFEGEELALDVGPFFSLGVPSETDMDRYEVELKLLGRLPVGKAAVSVVSQMHVIPSGHAVGILTSSEGLIVLRTSPVLTRSGQQRSPAAEAGIRPGDVIVAIGDTPITHPMDVEAATQYYGRRNRSVPVTIRRNGQQMRLWLNPVAARRPGGAEDVYVLGVYLKDPAAGVGTLTFWEPQSKLYGALGHQVSEEGEAMMMHEGRIVPAQIHGIQAGERGRPGEKMGVFEQGPVLGSIDRNTPFGIFGRLVFEPEAVTKPVPIALNQDVRVGTAHILTVLEGQRVESFDVEIIAVHGQSRPSGKGLVIRVTDERLLAKTRGIVQGMSGSPIIQDGKFVGAVTHVFVNDPTRGFGVLAEWMVYEAGLATLDSRYVPEREAV